MTIFQSRKNLIGIKNRFLAKYYMRLGNNLYGFLTKTVINYKRF